MNNQQELSEKYINDIKTHFRKEYQDKIEADIVDNTLKSFETVNDSSSHLVKLTLKGFIFYSHLGVNDIETKAKFSGNGGGLGAGLSAGSGRLYLAKGFSFDDLYKHTVSFEVNSLVSYINVNFFNSHIKLLAHIQGASIGLGFIGGGKGSWTT